MEQNLQRRGGGGRRPGPLGHSPGNFPGDDGFLTAKNQMEPWVGEYLRLIPEMDCRIQQIGIQLDDQQATVGSDLLQQ